MALRDLNDAWGWIQKLVRRVSRLESGAMLENSSITNGRMRFVGGLLRIDSGGSVQIVGTLSIDGTTTVTGTFTVSGPWNLTGNGTITGAVTITGNVTSTGTLTQNGPWNLNGVGTIAGNVTQTGDLTVSGGGKITIPGDNPIVLENVGGVAHIGVGGSEIRGGDNGIVLDPGSGATIGTTSAGVRIWVLPTIDSASVGGAVPGTLWMNATGYIYRVV